MDVELADGRSLYANTGGTGFDRSKPVVVLVHGAGAEHTLWRGQTRYLSHHGFSPLAIDLPGHGRSTGGAVESIEEMSETVLALLEGLGVEAAALVGHSMGSLVALDLAGCHPDRTSGLVLVATSPVMAVHPDLLDSARAEDDHSLELARAWMHGRHAGGDPEPGTWRAGFDWRQTAGVGLDVYAKDLAACRAFEVAGARADAVTCPSLVLSGSADRMTDQAGGAVLAHMLGAKHVVLDAGHVIPGEAPWELTKLLVDFLSFKTAVPD